MPLHHLQFTVFLHTHRSEIITLLEAAYEQTGGYYGTLALRQRRSQANIDSVEFIADLLRGDVDWDQAARLVDSARAAGLPVSDVLRMTTHLETLFVAFVRQYTHNDATFGEALIRRSSHVTACFRAKALFVDLRRRRHKATVDVVTAGE
ncbi:MAG: hypothetical protein M3Z04_11925 [Chloroflexota bacterium]|nr:hypothetical protein [Chloroflexota bacterium]